MLPNCLHGLVTITDNPKAIMHYTNYEEEIVQRYGIELKGWTYDKLTNPSNLSSSLIPLKTLRDALVTGTCKFVKLTAAEKKDRETTYRLSIASGDVEVRKRKRRSDAGIKRKSKRARKEDGNSSENDEEGEEQNEGDADDDAE